MSVIQFLILLVVAAICGALGQSLAGYSLGGCFVSAIVGFLGAFLGLWVARQFGLPDIFSISVGGEQFPVLWSIVGSALLSLIIGLLSRRRFWAR